MHASEKVMTEAQSSRLQRVMDATRRLLGEVGAERMTMRDLAAASDVAIATLYNRFGSKDNIVLLAVLDHYEQSIRSGMNGFKVGATPLKKIIHGLGLFDADIKQVPGLARALMSSYFRIDGNREMPEALYSALYETWMPLLHEMRQRRELRSWVPLELLCEELCDREFGIVMKWGQNAIPDRDLLKRLKFSVLSGLLSASSSGQARLIERELRRENGPKKIRHTS